MSHQPETLLDLQLFRNHDAEGRITTTIRFKYGVFELYTVPLSESGLAELMRQLFIGHEHALRIASVFLPVLPVPSDLIIARKGEGKTLIHIAPSEAFNPRKPLA